MENIPTQPIETEEQRSIREAQERNQALYDRMLDRKGREEPNPLRVIINECMERARPNEVTVHLPDVNQ